MSLWALRFSFIPNYRATARAGGRDNCLCYERGIDRSLLADEYSDCTAEDIRRRQQPTGTGSSGHEHIANDLTQAIARMAHDRIGNEEHAAAMSSADARVLSCIVVSMLEERGRSVDQHMLQALDRSLRGFVGRVMLGCAEEVARKVLSMVFQEELHFKILAKIRRCYELELADVQASPPSRYVLLKSSVSRFSVYKTDCHNDFSL